MINIDLWYNNTVAEVNRLDIYFNDLNADYHGNLYINKKCVGGIVADTVQEIQATFPQITFNFN